MSLENSRINVVGLSRNVGTRINKEVKRISKLLKNLKVDAEFFVVESDSVDNTILNLEELKNSLPNFGFISLGVLESKIPNRVMRLIECRNRYIQEIRTNSKLTESEFTLVVDFDIRNSALDLESLADFTKNSRLNWKVVSCNQTGRYFDIYALRAHDWNMNDCLQTVEDLTKSMSREEAKTLAIWQKMRRIPIGGDPIRVESAFGGMALYRTDVFKKYDYSTDSEVINLESEHVILHKKITEDGGQIFILPSFTNFAWNPHNLASFRTLRRLDRVSKKLPSQSVRRILRKLVD